MFMFVLHLAQSVLLSKKECMFYEVFVISGSLIYVYCFDPVNMFLVLWSFIKTSLKVPIEIVEKKFADNVEFTGHCGVVIYKLSS
jgi:hypothetical protein